MMLKQGCNILKSLKKTSNLKISKRAYSFIPNISNRNTKIIEPRAHPYWFERDTELHNLRAMDLFSRLLKDRIVLIDGPIDNNTASEVVAQLLLLESESPTDEIKMYINSPGGSIHSGMAIYDTMQFIQAPVSTLCIGYACSMASLLLAAGEPGRRKALPHSFVMIHQPLSGIQGQASDIEIHAKQVLRLKTMLNKLYNKHTNQPLDVIEKTMDRDTWLTAEEAKEWNLIDDVIEKKKDVSEENK